MTKRMTTFLKVLFILIIAFGLIGCSKASSEEVDAISKVTESQEAGDSDSKEVKLSKDEKQKMFEEYAQKLKDSESRIVKYGQFLDEDFYVYVVTNTMDSQKDMIMIASIDDGKVVSKFQGADLEKKDTIKGISKVFINRLEDVENPNVCIVRQNDEYTKVQILEVKNKKTINYLWSCKQSNTSDEYEGNDDYKYTLNLSSPDYSIVE